MHEQRAAWVAWRVLGIQPKAWKALSWWERKLAISGLNGEYDDDESGGNGAPVQLSGTGDLSLLASVGVQVIQ